MIMANKDFVQHFEKESVKIEDLIYNFESKCVVFGLQFPESALDYQKCILYLSHMAMALRNAVLKGVVIPDDLLQDLYTLSDHIQFLMRDGQPQK